MLSLTYMDTVKEVSIVFIEVQRLRCAANVPAISVESGTDYLFIISFKAIRQNLLKREGLLRVNEIQWTMQDEDSRIQQTKTVCEEIINTKLTVTASISESMRHNSQSSTAHKFSKKNFHH